MPIALVSDIHGSDRALAAGVAELERIGVERAVCLGDAVQGGDEPRQVLERLAALGRPVVLGNADAFLLEVPSDPVEEITPRHLEKRESTLAQLDATHLDQIPPWRVQGFDALAGGHTHMQWTRVVGGALYVNPGSVAVSDDGLAQFAILTGPPASLKRVAWNGS